MKAQKRANTKSTPATVLSAGPSAVNANQARIAAPATDGASTTTAAAQSHPGCAKEAAQRIRCSACLLTSQSGTVDWGSIMQHVQSGILLPVDRPPTPGTVQAVQRNGRFRPIADIASSFPSSYLPMPRPGGTPKSAALTGWHPTSHMQRPGTTSTIEV